MLSHLQQTSFIGCLIVVEKVLSLVQVTHAVLQKKNVTLAQASSTVANTVASLERLRCDSAWKHLWNEICLLKDTVVSQ